VQETTYFDSPRPYRTDRSQGGRPLRLGGRTFTRGLGVHARSVLTYALGGSYTTFAATIGIDSEVGNGGSVVFRVVGDERTLYESPVMRGGDAPVPVSVDLAGVLLLRLEALEAENANIADHANWAEARLLK
jgi:beta-galactosidase